MGLTAWFDQSCSFETGNLSLNLYEDFLIFNAVAKS